MDRHQASTCHDTKFWFNGQQYLVKAARIEADYWPAFKPTWEGSRWFNMPTPLLPPVKPPKKSDAEVYRIDDEGFETFVCWLADAPASFRADYARKFVILGLCPQVANMIPSAEVNEDKVFAYAK